MATLDHLAQPDELDRSSRAVHRAARPLAAGSTRISNATLEKSGGERCGREPGTRVVEGSQRIMHTVHRFPGDPLKHDEWRMKLIAGLKVNEGQKVFGLIFRAPEEVPSDVKGGFFGNKALSAISDSELILCLVERIPPPSGGEAQDIRT